MLGYLRRLEGFDATALSSDKLALWLQAINSDVLSATEKDSPVVQIHLKAAAESAGKVVSWTISRSARGFEGEDYLAMLERWDTDQAARAHADQSSKPHMQKLRIRMKVLRTLLDGSHA